MSQQLQLHVNNLRFHCNSNNNNYNNQHQPVNSFCVSSFNYMLTTRYSSATATTINTTTNININLSTAYVSAASTTCEQLEIPLQQQQQ